MIYCHRTWSHPPSGLCGPAHTACRKPPGCSSDRPGLEEPLPSGSQSPGWLASCRSEVPSAIGGAACCLCFECKQRPAPPVPSSRMSCSPFSRIRQSSSCEKSMGLGKTQCIALLAAFFALRGHQVYLPPEKTLRLLLWPPSYKSCCPGLLTMRDPLPFGFCLTHKLARVHES